MRRLSLITFFNMATDSAHESELFILPGCKGKDEIVGDMKDSTEVSARPSQFKNEKKKQTKKKLQISTCSLGKRIWRRNKKQTLII